MNQPTNEQPPDANGDPALAQPLAGVAAQAQPPTGAAAQAQPPTGAAAQAQPPPAGAAAQDQAPALPVQSPADREAPERRDSVVEPGESGPQDEKVSVRRVVRTTVFCTVAGGAGHLLIWLGYLLRVEFNAPFLPWQFCVGLTVALVGAGAFGGFYSATLRARVAITASVLLTFLLLLSYDLSVVELFRKSGQTVPSLLADDLRRYVGTVIVFYFGSEALISGSKAIGVAFGKPENASKVMSSDRDLARRPVSAEGELVGVLKRNQQAPAEPGGGAPGA